jgi:hypothetical protein
VNQADHIERARRNALWVFGFASLTALSLGAVVMAHVEGIFGLAWSQSPGLAIIMGVSLAVAALSPLIVWAAHPMGLIAPARPGGLPRPPPPKPVCSAPIRFPWQATASALLSAGGLASQHFASVALVNSLTAT